VPLQQGEDPAVLAAAAQRLRGLGVGIEDLSANQLAARAPALAVTAGGWWLPGGRVDPRRCLVALHAACLAAGVTLRYGVAATRIEPGAVIAADGAALAADEVVIASGAWSPALAALTGCALHGEPVKGQMVRFAVPDGLLPGFVHARQAYLIPRSGAGIVVGATMVSSGFDKTEDADAIARLAAGARRLVPALADLPIAESWTGLRPRLDGGLPLIARLRPGLVVATGHFRNGILLAPETAAQVTDLV
jgi:glycine oxidase